MCEERYLSGVKVTFIYFILKTNTFKSIFIYCNVSAYKSERQTQNYIRIWHCNGSNNVIVRVVPVNWVGNYCDIYLTGCHDELDAFHHSEM